MSFSKTTSLASLALTGLFVVFKFALASTTETPAPIECTAGATKTVDAPSSGSVVFQCGDKLTISPSGEGDVFYGKECTDSRKLTTVLPGAVLTAKVEQPAKGPATYTLSYDGTPEKPQVLCYKCVAEAGAPAGRNNDGSSAPTPKDCKLIVRVPGADGRVTSGFDPVSLTGKVLAPGLAGLLITFV
ncbi:SAG-related sequence SRS34A [Toxoplasma gondii RUB]|uniref:SAG-related sequence SRS34A n=3 Tax=Toxoplasma gondii TaxID=5811 RepID=A0A086LYF8_TOXGO|nr:surface antigen P22 [Toxoplasma gondii]KFG61676.1 SAG-related sequence SRS34A [Toxoplasma gondii RUB]